MHNLKVVCKNIGLKKRAQFGSHVNFPEKVHNLAVVHNLRVHNLKAGTVYAAKVAIKKILGKISGKRRKKRVPYESKDFI